MAVVISLKMVYTPVDDNVTSPHKSQVTSHKPLCHGNELPWISNY